tara:strand:+ start:1805 stop:2095 length:291 start_codon:yes stop_codon:yes gene_type:complete
MKRINVSKNDVLKEINADFGIPNKFINQILSIFMDIIIEGLNTNQIVKISGFGTFKVLAKKARIGRNPKTKKEYEISARHTVVFKPSMALKKLINE